jgi:riboflavin synthase
MFTGIIEETAIVKNTRIAGDGRDIEIECTREFLENSKLGDSIAINGACQSITRFSPGRFTFFSSRQTLELTNLGLLKPGDTVNLEKALQLSQRLDGHIVTGHIDGMGKVHSIRKQQQGYLFSFEVPEHLLETLVSKGSIAVDGISLTVYSLENRIATVSVIPITFEHTTLKFRNPGETVNIETDILGKYVVQYLKKMDSPSKLSLNFLRENGFA